MNRESKRMTLARAWWQEGYKENFTVNSEGSLLLADRRKRGFYFSKALDMTENEMTYHRLLMDCILNQDSNMRISVRASDIPYIIYNGIPVNIDNYLSDSSVGTTEKLELFNDKESVSYYKTTDLLLHKIKGRYLWIMISATDMSEDKMEFKNLSIEIMQTSFIQYLPEIYQNNSEFLVRYLGIFQSIYLDMERNIDLLPQFLDVDTATGEFLNYLASWLGVYNEGSILNKEQFRYMIKNAIKLNRSKGTIESISDMVKLYTGEEPYIVEFFELKKFVSNNPNRERLYNEIYTDNPHVFCIILKSNEIFRKGGKIGELSQLIEKIRPANTVAKILVLKPSIRLDIHSYIGVNTTLEQYNEAAINEKSSLDGSFYLMA